MVVLTGKLRKSVPARPPLWRPCDIKAPLSGPAPGPAQPEQGAMKPKITLAVGSEHSRPAASGASIWPGTSPDKGAAGQG